MSMQIYSLLFNNNSNSEYTYITDDDMNYMKNQIKKYILIMSLMKMALVILKKFKFMIPSKKHGFKINLCDFTKEQTI